MCLKNPKSFNRNYRFEVPRATAIHNRYQLTGIILIESMMPSFITITNFQLLPSQSKNY